MQEVSGRMQATTGLADCLALAFVDDPLMSWVYPDPTKRLAQATEWWSICLSIGVERGAVDAVDGADGVDVGVAIWSPPGVALFDEEAVARLFTFLSVQVGDDVGRVGMGLSSIAGMKPPGDHWYLFGIGVDPSVQASGLGRQLVRHRLDECDGTGASAYLESSNIRNLPFYERLGYRVVDEVTLPDGPTIRGMLRASGPL